MCICVCQDGERGGVSVLLNERCERSSAAGVGRELVLSYRQYRMCCVGYREPVKNVEAPQDPGKLSVCETPLLERATGGQSSSPLPPTTART